MIREPQTDAITTEYERLFGLLNPVTLKKIARKSGSEETDILQQAHMFCWEIASGISTFDPQKGSVEQFVMGSLWKQAERDSWAISGHIRGEVSEAILSALIDESPTPAQSLEQKQEPHEVFEIDALKEFGANLIPIDILFLTGWSVRSIAKHTSTSKSAVMRHLKKEWPELLPKAEPALLFD